MEKFLMCMRFSALGGLTSTISSWFLSMRISMIVLHEHYTVFSMQLLWFLSLAHHWLLNFSHSSAILLCLPEIWRGMRNQVCLHRNWNQWGKLLKECQMMWYLYSWSSVLLMHICWWSWMMKSFMNFRYFIFHIGTIWYDFSFFNFLLSQVFTRW